jgi:hypothetical protein
MEGSLVAYKVFTNGSTLQASELNENLMQQSTAVFSNAAARTAAITSPVEGQLTYLEDTNQYASWSGSEWVSPFGLTLIAQQAVGSGVGTITFSNVFSAAYDDYRVIYSGGVSTGSGYIGCRLGLNGTPATASNYKTAFVAVGYSTSAVTGAGSTAVGSFAYSGRYNTDFADLSLEIRSPFLSRHTRISGAFSLDGGQGANVNGVHELATSYNDFIVLGGSFTGGTISVYGYKKV